MGANFDSDITVNVYGSATPVKRQSFGVLMLASQDVGAGFTEDYRLYESPQEAAADTDLQSGTQAMIAAFYSQPSHPRKVGVAAMVADVAMIETFTINAGPAANDVYSITINGIESSYTAGATPTPSTVAAGLRSVMQTNLAAEAVTVAGADPDITVTVDVAGDDVTFSSSYTAAGGGTSGITEVATKASVSIKTQLDTLLQGYDDFYAVAAYSRAKVEQQRLAEWTVANTRLALIQSSDADIIAGTAGNLFATLYAASNGRAVGLYHDTDAEYGDAAWGAAGLWVDPDQKASVWYDKTLTGITTIPGLTSAQKTQVLAYNGNLYPTLKSVGATGPGKLFSGDWVDDLITEDWFKARLEEDLAQLKLDLSNRGEKIPYTNRGLAMLESVIRARVKTGWDIGHLDEESGVVIDVPDISDVTSADILARQAVISVTAYKTGGIKDITVNVGLLNS